MEEEEEEEVGEKGENEAIFSCVGRTEVYKRPHCMHWSLLPKSVFISIKNLIKKYNLTIEVLFRS